MAQQPLPRLPQTIYNGDLTDEERLVLRARYRRIMRKMRRNDELTDVERALHTLLIVFLTTHVVTLDHLESLVDAELDDAEEDKGGPDYVEGVDAEEDYEASIAERTRVRNELRNKYETAYRILMNPTRRSD